MKIAVFTVMLPEWTPEMAAAELQAAGYDGVEWRVTRTVPERRHEAPSFWGNNRCTLEPTTADAQRARTLAAQHGLAIPSLGTYIDMGDLAAVETTLAFAQAVGAPQFRIRAGSLTAEATYAEVFARARGFLARVQPLALHAGVKILIEMHPRTITPSAGLAYRLVDGFDPAAVGVIYDVGNLVDEGYEAYPIGLELLGPYLAHVHVKNGAFRRPEGGGVWQATFAPLEDGVVDFTQFFRALRATGYAGWLSVEDFSVARPYRALVQHNLTFLRQVLNTLD
jgi:sugar phosphate isomerase/epimerase